MVECANCHKAAIVASTLIERDQKGKIQLYCSSACVDQSRPAQHILSGEWHTKSPLLGNKFDWSVHVWLHQENTSLFKMFKINLSFETISSVLM